MKKFKKIIALVFVFAMSIGFFAGHNALADTKAGSCTGANEVLVKFDLDGGKAGTPEGTAPAVPPTEVCAQFGPAGTFVNFTSGDTNLFFPAEVNKTVDGVQYISKDAWTTTQGGTEKANVAHFELTDQYAEEGLTFYPIWTKVETPVQPVCPTGEFNVIIDLQGGKGTYANTGGEPTLPPNAEGKCIAGGDNVDIQALYGHSFPTKVEKDGKTAIGWTLEGSNVLIDVNHYKLDGDIKIVPAYEEFYDVSFDLAGGNINGEESLATIQLPYEGSINLDTLTPEKAGYTFLGWSVNGETVTGEYKVTEAVKFVAQWERQMFDVSFDLAGGNINGEESLATIQLPYEGSINLDTLTPEKAGYTFLGWSVNGETVTGEYKVTEAVKFVAQWKAIDGGNGGETTPPTEPETNKPTEPTEKLPETGSDAMVIAVVALLSATGLIAVRRLRA